MKKLFILLIMSALVLGLFAGFAQAQEGQKITAIEVVGNQYITTLEILDPVTIKVGDTFDPEQIKKEMQAIYDLGYFQDVKASLQNYEDGIKVIFEVVENPVISEIKIEGNEIFTKEQVIDWLSIQTGQVLNVEKLNQGLKEVRNRYQDKGYVLAKFTDVNISDEGVLNLKFNIGYLNDIILKGNEKTKDFVVMRELKNIKTGEPLNINYVQESYRNLYNLKYFTEINPQLERVEEAENQANLVVNLKEDKTGKLNFGAGYSSRDGWLGFINVQERNLMGNGQTLGFRWQFGETNTYSLDFFEPWIFGNPTSFGIGVYNTRSKSENSAGEKYTEKRRGGNISLGHALTDQWDGTVRYKLEETEYDWEEQADTANSIRSLTFKVDRDTTNHPFNPTSGAIDSASIEYAGSFLGGDRDFTKYNLDVRRYFPGFKAGQAWAVRLKTGIGQGDLPYSELYRLGGSESLRGYKSYSFEGNDMLLMNLEYRFPIAEQFTGVIFADGGNAWDSLDDIDLGDINHSLGLGIRLNTPIGQIRLDYGWNEDWVGMPHFSLGNTF